VIVKAKGGYSLAWLIRGRFCTQRGGLVRARNDGTHPRSPGSFSRPPTMVIASRSLPRYNHLLIRCFVTLVPEMGILYPCKVIIFTHLKTLFF